MHDKVTSIASAATVGTEGVIVQVECDISNGLPSLSIVGMGSKSIDEAKDRVRSAIKHSRLDMPAKKITINLAPASLPKDGALYDLPIAIAILASSGIIDDDKIATTLFVGELALNGNLRAVKGIISIVQCAKEHGFTQVVVPLQNVAQAVLIDGIEIIPANSLSDVFFHTIKQRVITPAEHVNYVAKKTSKYKIDAIIGQLAAKRAALIAVAGGHNLLLSGSPGSGKSMLAKALAELLPPLGHEEAIEVTRLHSLVGNETEHALHARPFRAPHHTASHIAMVGGGTKPMPGEISLAHKGVLFMDEIPEFQRSVIESLRQPLEDKTISITRSNSKVSYPADFMLVATQNPCPCGFLGDTKKMCTCNPSQISNYQKKLSGPFLDRIDLFVAVDRVDNAQLLNSPSPEHRVSETFLAQIKTARERQYRRNGGHTTNSLLDNAHLTAPELLADEAKIFLTNAADKLSLSARSFFRALKVARTIADLDESERIEVRHVAEALQFRQQ